MNNKYFKPTNNKYLEQKSSEKNVYFQKRLFSKATVTTNENPYTNPSTISPGVNTNEGLPPNWNSTDIDNLIWFDGRKFGDVKKDKTFIQNMGKLTPSQKSIYMSAALDQLTERPDDLYHLQVAIPDASKTDILANNTWFPEYAVESTEKRSFNDSWVYDWQKYIPPGIQVDETNMQDVFWKLWDDHIAHSRQTLLGKIGTLDAIKNPFGNQPGTVYNTSTPTYQPGASRIPTLGTIYDTSYINTARKKRTKVDPFQVGTKLTGNIPFEPKFKQIDENSYSVSIPGSPVMINNVPLVTNEIIVPGKFDPNKPPKVDVNPKNPFFKPDVKITPRSAVTQGAVDPISEAFMARYNPKITSLPKNPYLTLSDESETNQPVISPTPMPKSNQSTLTPGLGAQAQNYMMGLKGWWDKMFGEEKTNYPNINNNNKSYFPNDKTESAGTSGYRSYVFDQYGTPTPSPNGTTTKSLTKKRGSMNKMMGGKSGRMGPEITDEDGTKGRYFQKKAKRKTITEKFYETDKPHGPQMKQMQKRALTKAQMRLAQKMYEINDSNYYGEEKPQPKNTFRKNSMMGNPVNMNSSYAGSMMPRKKSFSLDTPRAKTPSPMNGISKNPFYKPDGGSLKRYNPYPRSGSAATGMPPTMTGGFTTKRMKPKAKPPVSVRAKYGC